MHGRSQLGAGWKLDRFVRIFWKLTCGKLRQFRILFGINCGCLPAVIHAGLHLHTTCIITSHTALALISDVHSHTHTQPFYDSVEFVWDNPGEPVPEVTFTHSHSSWSSIIPICFLHLLRHMASSIFNPRALQSFSTMSLSLSMIYPYW